MAYTYPMGQAPPPGPGGPGGFGQGHGWTGAPAPGQHSYGHGHGGHGYQQGPPGGGYGHQQGPPPSQHYGSYGQNQHQNVFAVNAWQAIGFSSENELQRLYQQHKSPNPMLDGVQAEGLMRILNESHEMRNFYGINWSLELCKVMVAMLDRSKDGFLQYPEFLELLKCLTYWHQTFRMYDQNRSGYMEATELGRCIRDRLGYTISEKAMETLLKRYAHVTDNMTLLISFDDFVSCCVRMRAYTEAFRARDRQMSGGQESGSAMFGYDDFLQCVMCL